MAQWTRLLCFLWHGLCHGEPLLVQSCGGSTLSSSPPPLPFSSPPLLSFPLSLSFQLVAYHLPLLRKSIAIRSYLILAFFLWAFIVALSRISDYFHHPEDVLAGGIVGAVTSIYVVSCLHAS